MSKDREIERSTIRISRSLKKRAEDRARERGFKKPNGKANFSAYIRFLIEQDLE